MANVTREEFASVHRRLHIVTRKLAAVCDDIEELNKLAIQVCDDVLNKSREEPL